MANRNGDDFLGQSWKNSASGLFQIPMHHNTDPSPWDILRKGFDSYPGLEPEQVAPLNQYLDENIEGEKEKVDVARAIVAINSFVTEYNKYPDPEGGIIIAAKEKAARVICQYVRAFDKNDVDITELLTSSASLFRELARIYVKEHKNHEETT